MNALEIHRRHLESFALAIVKNRTVAEDIASETLAAAVEKSAQFRGDSAVKTWLVAIARRKALGYLRGRRECSLEEINESGRDFAAPESRDLSDTEKLAVVLRRVREKQRRALIDHFVKGLSVARMARDYQIPVGTVLSRISKGKEYLRHEWSAARA